MPAILAIDPGAKGALVFGDSLENPAVEKMPLDLATENGLIELIELCRDIKTSYPKVRCLMEKVGGYVGEAQPGSSMFSFGTNTSAVRAAVVAAGIPLEPEIVPSVWQKHLNLPKRGRTSKGKTLHKSDLKQRAQELFPDIRVTLWSADALLLYYLKMTNKI